MGGVVAQVISQISGIYLALRGNQFRSFVHDPRAIRKFIESQGFELRYKGKSFPWHVQAYQRKK
jgi:hypothetical protein